MRMISGTQSMTPLLAGIVAPGLESDSLAGVTSTTAPAFCSQAVNSADGRGSEDIVVSCMDVRILDTGSSTERLIIACETGSLPFGAST